MKKIKVILLAFVCLIVGLAFWVAFRIEANQQEYSFKPRVVATPRPVAKPSPKPAYKPVYQTPKPTPLPTPIPQQPQPTYVPYVPPAYNPPPAYSPVPFPSFAPLDTSAATQRMRDIVNEPLPTVEPPIIDGTMHFTPEKPKYYPYGQSD